MKTLTSHWFRPAAPRKAEAQTLAEYGLIIAIIAIGIFTDIVPSLAVDESAWFKQRARLQTAVDEAALANEEGNRPKERAHLSRAGGAASAMIGMTRPCDEPICDEARVNLRRVIGLIAVLKSRTTDDSCGDGVIDDGEECDPNADPDGCDRAGDALCTAECFCHTP
jgi:hypothetical protein